MDICKAVKWLDKYLSLFTDTEVNNKTNYCFSIYQNQWIASTKLILFLLRNEGKLECKIQKNARR